MMGCCYIHIDDTAYYYVIEDKTVIDVDLATLIRSSSIYEAKIATIIKALPNSIPGNLLTGCELPQSIGIRYPVAQKPSSYG